MKNKTLITLSMFTTMILSLSAQAGTEMHGGDSVVCFQNIAQKQKVETILRQNKLASQMGYIRQDPFSDINMDEVTVETLDIWEARQSTDTPKEFVDIADVNTGVQERIEAMEKKVKFIADRMNEAQNSFYNPSKWLASATGVVEIDDAHELINYTNLCIPVQLAVQTDTRVYYDRRLYSKLDEMNKTALVLHELLYSWVKNFSKSSLNVRKYVGLMMLKDFENYPVDELVKEMAEDFKKANSHPFRQPFIVSNQCQKTMTLEGLEIKGSYSLVGLNSSVCDFQTYELVDFLVDSTDHKLLEEKLGRKISDKISGIIREGVLTLSLVRLVDGGYSVPTVTPFMIYTNSYSNALYLPIENNKVVPLYPTNVTYIEILGQKLNIESNWIEYKKTASGKMYLSQVRLDLERSQSIKLKSTSGFKNLKKCEYDDFVQFSADGLVISCKSRMN